MKHWQIEQTARFVKELKALDRTVQRQIAAMLDAIADLDDPRQRGKALIGELHGYWRYRVGDYRVIADIHDDEVCVIAITVGHRSRVYH